MSDVLVVVAALLNVIAVVVAAILVIRLRRRARTIEESARELAAMDPQLLATAKSAVVGKPRIITLEILNPIEVAKSRVKIAGVAGAVAPNLIRKVVYGQTVTILHKQLADFGVKADVRIHVAD